MLCLLIGVLVCLPAVGCGDGGPDTTGTTEAGGEGGTEDAAMKEEAEAFDFIDVKLTEIPAMRLVASEVRGGLDRHPEALQRLDASAERVGVAESNSNFVGIYPIDPDAVDSQDQMVYYLGVETPQAELKLDSAPVALGLAANGLRPNLGTLEAGALALPRLPRTDAGVIATTLPATQAIIANTSFKDIEVAGLACKIALFTGDWVQIAATRNVLVSGSIDNPAGQQVQIVFPVKKRPVSTGVDQISAVRSDRGNEIRLGGGGAVLRVQETELPATTVMRRTVQGGWDEPGGACKELLSAAREAGAETDSCMKIELVDPHAVDDPGQLIWQIAAEVPAGTKAVGPYEVAELPATRAVVRSDAKAERVMGETLAMNAFVVGNSLVHSAPKRYHISPGGEAVRIEIPVRERSRQIPLGNVRARLSS